MRREEGEGRVQRNRRGPGRESSWSEGGWGASPGYPGDRKCLLPVASCLFPTSHFSVVSHPPGPTPLTQALHPVGGWELATW